MLLLAGLTLTAAAWLRSAEYDEQYTLFLTAGTPRPIWPSTAFPAGVVAAAQVGLASLSGIARDLRATDVHPPLYFWIVAIWRAVFGPSLFAARMLSVLCGTASIGLVGTIAIRCRIAPTLATLLTLGCYGFVYTNAIARGFAPAQMLILGGVTLLLGRRPLLAGLCLGAACCCNYLAVFPAAAVVAMTGLWLAIPAAAPFLALDAWFFVAQHAARAGQFPPFRVWPSLVRLAEYQAAAVFGGLPLYVDEGWRATAQAVLGLFTIALLIIVARAKPSPMVRMLLAGAVAPAAGLLLLGAVFNNTPIELRYLCFGLPFIALLITASAPLHLDLRRGLHLPLVLTIQFASIAGLLFSPRTMQPARITASAAASHMTDDTIVLLPAGNDGVGIVGAFGIEAPPSMPILLLHPDDNIAARVASYHRVALALLAQDPDSVTTVAHMRSVFAPPNWRRVAIGSNLEVYERTDDGG